MNLDLSLDYDSYYLLAAIPLALFVPVIAYGMLLRRQELRGKSRGRQFSILGLITVVLMVATGLGVIIGVWQSTAGRSAAVDRTISEVHDQYGLSLSRDQAAHLALDFDTITLNDGTRVLLQREADGSWKLVTPGTPSEVPSAQ